MPALAPELGYGKAVHHLMRAVAEHTKETGQPPNQKAVDHLLATDFYLPLANKPAHREMKQAAQRLVNQYIDEHSDELKRVWATERPFELSLDGVVVSGRADVIFDEHDGVPTHLSIVDYKTSTGAATNGLQLQVYADAGRREGLEVVGALIHDLKTSKRIDVPIKPSDVTAAERVVQDAAKRMRQREYVPDPGLAKCSKCDVRRLCRASAART
jgi:DNA helicase II / ATP-dependent DNA helicase PcrA